MTASPNTAGPVLAPTRPRERELPTSEASERLILGATLLDNSVLAEVLKLGLGTGDFAFESHRRFFVAMCEIHERGESIDFATLQDHMGPMAVAECGGSAYIASLVEGLPLRCEYKHHVKILKVHKARRDQLVICSAIEARIYDEPPAEVGDWAIEQIKLSTERISGSLEWRPLFHTYEEYINAPPMKFAIGDFLQEDAVTLIGALSGQSKTLTMLAMVEAMLNGSPLFDYFAVPRTSNKILYLIPESSIGPFWARLKLFNLQYHVQHERLFVRTLSSKEQVSLTDPRILQAAEGADFFLDTCTRFMEGSENDAESGRAFAENLFALLKAGARTITGAHHSPKSFENADRMSLENVLRGTGDFGAMLATAWGLRQIDAASNRVWVQNLKPRDFQPCQPFIIEGRPWLDQEGRFKMVAKPGEAGELRDHLGTRQRASETPEKQEKIREAVEMRSAGKSVREIADALGTTKSSVSRWLKDQPEPGGDQ